MDDMRVLAGSGSRQLAQNICRHFGVALGHGEMVRFSEGSLFVRVGENVRGRQVFLVQSTNYNLQ